MGRTLSPNKPGVDALSPPVPAVEDAHRASTAPADPIAFPSQPEKSRVLQPALFLCAALAIALGLSLDRPADGLLGIAFPMLQMALFASSAGLAVAGIAAHTTAGVAEVVARWQFARSRDAVRGLALMVVQLGLLWVVIVRFKLENEAFYQKIAALAFAGFVVHYFLPARQRMRYFVALSFTGIASVLGLLNGAWLVAVGLALMGICHLPLRYAARVALLLAVGGVLALARVDRIVAPWSSVLWPVIGSFFMFRLIVYLYDLEHSKTRPTLESGLSYLFLLPNVVFPFFPVVDYSAFRRTYYNEDEFAIYQRGVQWMVRGVLQLIAYRFVYHHLTIPTTSVHTPADLAQYIVFSFMLYIRVSGQFHLVTGMLHLFGFNLPLTNDRYFLASSLTDLYRRMNIYWKDFMMKLVFMPAYIRLQKYGERKALILSTASVFAVTWVLHSYQWFWLLGEFPITAIDLIFWGILGSLMIVNVLHDAKHNRGRRLPPTGFSIRTRLPIALRTVATFVFMAVLWSFWTSPSIKDWVALVTVN